VRRRSWMNRLSVARVDSSGTSPLRVNLCPWTHRLPGEATSSILRSAVALGATGGGGLLEGSSPAILCWSPHGSYPRVGYLMRAEAHSTHLYHRPGAAFAQRIPRAGTRTRTLVLATYFGTCSWRRGSTAGPRGRPRSWRAELVRPGPRRGQGWCTVFHRTTSAMRRWPTKKPGSLLITYFEGMRSRAHLQFHPGGSSADNGPGFGLEKVRSRTRGARVRDRGSQNRRSQRLGWGQPRARTREERTTFSRPTALAASLRRLTQSSLFKMNAFS